MNVRILEGDALAVLRTLADESVNCCVTSPCYWGLRDYGVPGQMGLEKTPEEFVERLVAVFREVRRVLRDDGTIWVNLGDSYAASTKGSGGHNPKQDSNAGSWHDSRRWKIPGGLKQKDLVGIPWRVAFALQADGWWLRSDIIWHKPNPMPESVTDRPTKAHEYLFLLAKSARYYYDAKAIAEPCKLDTPRRYERGRSDHHKNADGGPGNQTICKTLEHMRRRSSGNVTRKLANGTDSRLNTHMGSSVPWTDTGEGRNRRTVWTVSTKPFKGAHFATFPPKLIEPCILAGCPPGGVVLDPFCGSGTTGMVARQHGRNFVGIELNPDYAVMARARAAYPHVPAEITRHRTGIQSYGMSGDYGARSHKQK